MTASTGPEGVGPSTADARAPEVGTPEVGALEVGGIEDGGGSEAEGNPTSAGRHVRMMTSDLVSVEITAESSDSILTAAELAGLTLPSLCHQGSCGVCHAQLVSGEVDLGGHTELALSSEAIEQGGILLCAARARSDLEISLPYERSRIIDWVMPERSGVIESVQECAQDTMRLVVKVAPDESVGAGLQFEAGQFVALRRPDSDQERAYSLANVANWEGTAEFFIKLREGGFFSQYLRNEAAVGDELVMRGPSGTFGLHENGLRPRWFVCGGTGMAPLMSMVRRMAQWQDPQPVRMMLGVDREAEIFGLELLAELDLPGGIETEVSVRMPGSDWRGSVGTAVDLLAACLDSASESPDIYLCGSHGFLAAARLSAENAGVPDSQVYAETILAN